MYKRLQAFYNFYYCRFFAFRISAEGYRPFIISTIVDRACDGHLPGKATGLL